MQAWQRHMHTGWPGRQQAAVGALHNLEVEDAHEKACVLTLPCSMVESIAAN